MPRTLVLALVVAACSSKHGATTNGSGTSAPAGTGCDGARAKVEQLYRDEATAREKPERVEEAVADNTAMVMNDCAQAPERVAACIARATTARELEQQCLVPLDDEGSEGEALRK